ncbi:methyltransferase domain-containing protein [Microbacterium sp. RD1]|uniref:methyltransferase domain-containing protein n=1 Tax=Microbacterium sp. RD1 TaxID=3457313 RepID=UPI003FA611D8
MAEQYLHGHHSSVVSSHARRTAENSVAYLLPRLREGMSLLDVGCGPGTITVDLAERVAPGRVVGIDTSEVALQMAREVAGHRGVQIDFHVDDAYALSAGSGEYDIVHAHQVLHHLTRPTDAIAEFARVAGAEGIVALREVDYEGISWFPHVPALDEWLDLFVRLGRTLGGEPSAGRRLLGWAQQAGLRDIEPSASVWLYATPEDRGWFADSWAQRATESDFARHALEHGLADRDALARIAEGWLEWAAAPDGWMLMPHAEIIARGTAS